MKVQHFGQSPRGKYPYFGVNQISLKHSVGQVEGSLHAKNQLNPFSHFSRTRTCDGQTDTQTQGHSIYRSITALHSKNWIPLVLELGLEGAASC